MTAPIRTMLRVMPREGRRADVIEYYRRHRIIEAAIERGLCEHGELIVPDDPHQPLLVTCVWPDRAAYDTWVRSRPAGVGDLLDLLEAGPGGLPAGDVYEIAILAGLPSADRSEGAS